MGDAIYTPLIDDMTWSYSRVRTYVDCPYKFYLRYILRLHGKDLFFASYGSFMHKLIEKYYKEGLTSQQLVTLYLQDFKNKVPGCAPNPKIFEGYFLGGLQYLQNIQPFPYAVVGVEKSVKFKFGDLPVVGFVDFVGEKDGEIYIVDHKSRHLKPRSKRKKPTKTDEELDEYLRQLYIYSIPVAKEFGKTPAYLCFNCFRDGILIEEPFKEKMYEEARSWFLNMISEIRVQTEFRPCLDYFKCTNLCEMQDECEYYELMCKGR